MKETKRKNGRGRFYVRRAAVWPFLLAASLLLLSACGLNEDAEPYSARAAMRKIATYGWVDEPYEIVGERREDTHPAQTVYFCRSKERPLEFTVTAGIYEEFFHNMSLGWKRSVGTDYMEQVLSQYREAAREIARSSPYYAEREKAADEKQDDGVYVFYADSAEALPEIARVICAVNEVYLPEMQFHKETKWSAYTDTAHVLRQTPEDGGILIDAVQLEGVNGTALDKRTLLEELRMAYEKFS